MGAPARERDQASVRRDVRLGYLSAGAALWDYGVEAKCEQNLLQRGLPADYQFARRKSERTRCLSYDVPALTSTASAC